MSRHVTAQLGPVPYRVELSDGTHRWLADIAAESGGGDAGPGPHELLLSALGACTAITLGLYARRKGFVLAGIRVALDIPEEGGSPMLTRIARTITLEGELEPAQRQRLLDIANACPLHKLLTGEIRIDTRLASAEVA